MHCACARHTKGIHQRGGVDLSERCERRGVRTCMQDQCVYICIFQSFIIEFGFIECEQEF